MFSWFKKKRGEPDQQPEKQRTVAPGQIPHRSQASPQLPISAARDLAGAASNEKPVRGELFLNGPKGNTAHRFDLVLSAAKMMRERGHQITAHDKWIVHDETGLIMQPMLDGIQLQPNGDIHVVTTVDVRHPLINAERVFEYQHSVGDGLVKILEKGFDLWVQGDLPVLLDAVSPVAKVCTRMELKSPATADAPAKTRRAMLGPVGHIQVQKPPVAEAHPFCTCCFFTKTGQVFKQAMNSDGFFAIRFFGMRDENGNAGADCRINGLEYEAGKAAIRDYVRTWPGKGFEVRKQYIIWQDTPETASSQHV